MHNRPVYRFLFICCLVLFAACKCDKSSYRLTNTQRSFSNFRKGSYWIMRDSLTNNLDSLVVLSADSTTLTGGASNPKCADEIDTRSFVINAYNATTGRANTLSMILTLDGQNRNVFSFQRGNAEGLNDAVSLSFTNRNVYVNGNVYDSVAVNDYRQDSTQHIQVYLHPSKVLLKVGYEVGTDKVVWLLDRANIIR